MSLFHRIADATAELQKALEADPDNDELVHGIRHNFELRDEAWYAYSVRLRPQWMTNTNAGSISQLPPDEPMQVAVFAPTPSRDLQ